jgi:phosphoribosyl-ATP pyrophosphohydrolase
MKAGLYETLERIAATIEERKNASPEKSYVARLLSQGEDAVLKKIGEEATETVLAAKSGDKLHLVRETADLWFHSMILLARHGLGPGDVLAELIGAKGSRGWTRKRRATNDWHDGRLYFLQNRPGRDPGE